MPTMIAKLGREKTIASLAKRIYAIEGRNSAELQRQAETALLAANPRLARKEGFRAGAAIKVPRLTKLKLQSDVEEAKANGEGIIQESTLRLQLLSSRIEDGYRVSLDRREKALEQLNDREFSAQALKSLPQARKVLSNAAESIQKNIEADQKEAERFESAVKQAQESLARLNIIRTRNPRG